MPSLIDVKKINNEEKSKKSEELEFTVMPKEYRKTDEAPPPVGEFSRAPGMLKNYLKILGVGLVALAVLGGGGFLVYNKFFKAKLETTNELNEAPTIQVPKTEPQDEDADKDGLLDRDEARLATSDQKPDTDGDGLADGDEANIYGSDPLLSDTDGDGYDDGGEVAKGYSPTLRVSQKATADVVKLWSDRIAIFQLHEPTPTTLKLKATNTQTQSKVTYTNAVYKYTLEIPAILTFREADEGRLLGVYISGTNPEAEVFSDPINASLAVKITSQNLKDWVTSQYQANDYELLRERDINGLKAIALNGIKDEACPQNKTFFGRDNTIIILTWTCNQNSPFADLYEQIVQSFKYVK